MEKWVKGIREAVEKYDNPLLAEAVLKIYLTNFYESDFEEVRKMLQVEEGELREVFDFLISKKILDKSENLRKPYSNIEHLERTQQINNLFGVVSPSGFYEWDNIGLEKALEIINAVDGLAEVVYSKTFELSGEKLQGLKSAVESKVEGVKKEEKRLLKLILGVPEDSEICNLPYEIELKDMKDDLTEKYKIAVELNYPSAEAALDNGCLVSLHPKPLNGAGYQNVVGVTRDEKGYSATMIDIFCPQDTKHFGPAYSGYIFANEFLYFAHGKKELIKIVERLKPFMN